MNDGARKGVVLFLREAWPAITLYGIYTLWRLFTYTDFPAVSTLRDLYPNTAHAKTGHAELSHHFFKLFIIMS